jgi:chromosomal replication initiation ATPase DnaA
MVIEMIRLQWDRRPVPAFGKLIDRHFSKFQPTNLRSLPNVPMSVLPAPLPEPKPPKKITISCRIRTLDNVIKLIDDNPLSEDVEYNVNMEGLHNASEPLRELNAMIGLKDLKRSVCDQVIYYVQGLHEGSDNDYMHTVIEGPPGTGKTEVAKILGQIFAKLGILKNKTFKKATRSDMVAGYLGQTALKTRELIEGCLGGVLFIDEAYALGNSEKKDSYSKECIDTLCEALSDHKDELMVIIAGYADQLDSCFFQYNDGLRSRFAWRFTTEDYSPEELLEILSKKVLDSKWRLDEGVTPAWFHRHKDDFEYAGRDVETLFAKAKIAHSRRLFEGENITRKEVSVDDLDAGFQAYTQNRSDSDKASSPISTMYL